MQKDDCIFCKIALHKEPSKIILETKGAIAFPSISPAAKVHVIVIPKEHIKSFTDLEEKHKDILIEMAKAVQKIIEKKKISNGYKLIFNGGKYQSIPHIHWHLLAGELEDRT